MPITARASSRLLQISWQAAPSRDGKTCEVGEPHWRVLIGWLEANGISARKKVHELRKLFGDAIVKQNGIFAGSAELRRSTIQMTASHYTDPRQRAALPVGNLFSDDSTKIVPDHNPQAEGQAQKLGS